MPCSELIPADPYRRKLIKRVELEKQRPGPSDLKEILPDRLISAPVVGNRCFHMLDGKVLKFHAVLDDCRGAEEGDGRKFIIHVTRVSHRPLG